MPHANNTNNLSSSETSAVLAPNTASVIERISKFKILKQKSLMYEIFARSSSASFERQASSDSSPCAHSTNNNNQHGVKATNSAKPIMSNLKANSIIVPSTSSLASSVMSNSFINNNHCFGNRMNHLVNSRLTTSFKPPALFSLVTTTATAPYRDGKSLFNRDLINLCFIDYQS